MRWSGFVALAVLAVFVSVPSGFAQSSAATSARVVAGGCTGADEIVAHSPLAAARSVPDPLFRVRLPGAAASPRRSS